MTGHHLRRALIAGFSLGSLTLGGARPVAAQEAQASALFERPEVIAFIDELARRDGFSADTLRAVFAHVQPLPQVIRLITPPADPGTRSWRAYRARFIEPRRIKAGRAFMQQHAQQLARAQARYGVPARIIAGIIGVETIYGRNTGSFNTLATLTTLAFDYPPRAALFRRELRELLLLARSEGRSPLSYQGSYAGALGLPQFLPGSIRAHGVDGDGDGRIDLTTSAADAIDSVANYLAANGWQRDAPIALGVQASGSGLDAALAAGIEPTLSARQWRERDLLLGKETFGGTAPSGKETFRGTAPSAKETFGGTAPSAKETFGGTAPSGKETFGGTAPRRDDAALDAAVLDLPAALIDLPSPDAPTEYRLGWRNFYVITRYNRSTFYAAAVMDLAQALR